MSRVVVRRYAIAFFDLTEEAGISDIVFNDLQALQELYEQSDEFQRLINDPVMPATDKQGVLDAALKSRIDKQTLTFLHFLAHKKRLDWLSEIIDAFLEMHLDSRFLLPAIIESRRALSKSQLENITERFQKISGKKILPDQRIIPEMLGGFRVRIEDMIYDHSIESKLNKFKRSIIHH